MVLVKLNLERDLSCIAREGKPHRLGTIPDIDHIEVTENDLRSLALKRAQQVKDSILKPGTIEAERIFLIEPKSLVPEKKEGVKDSRVDLMLK